MVLNLDRGVGTILSREVSRQLGYACVEIYVVTDIAAAHDLGPELVLARVNFISNKLNEAHLHYPDYRPEGGKSVKKAKSHKLLRSQVETHTKGQMQLGKLQSIIKNSQCG